MCGESALSIVRARPGDADELLALAAAAKGYWGYDGDWLARWRAMLRLPEVYLQQRGVYKALNGGGILGWYALVVEFDLAVLDHLWIAPAYIGRGYGAALFRHALARAHLCRARRLELEAEPHAAGFYQRMGMFQIGLTWSSMERDLPVMSLNLAPATETTPTVEDELTTLLWALEQQADVRAKAVWHGHLKGVLPFRGVRPAAIRAVLHDWRAAQAIDERCPADRQKDLALELLRETFCEDKLAGVFYLNEVLLPGGAIDWRADLPRFARLFDEGFIADRNTCHWFCARVLGPLIAASGPDCAYAVAGWQAGRTLWQRRAGAMAFANLAPHGEANFSGFTDLVLGICDATLRDPERLVRPATGRLLRELSRAEPERVTRFIEARLPDFPREVLRPAVSHLPPETQRRLKLAHDGGRSSRSRWAT